MFSVRTIANKFKNSNRLVGTGCYSVVYEINDDIVVKFADTLQDPCLYYYKLLSKFNSIHTPKVYSLREYKNGYSCRLEKLDPVPNTHYKFISELHSVFENQDFGKYLFKLLENKYSLVPNPDKFVCFLKQLSYLMPESAEPDLHTFNMRIRPSTGVLVITDPWKDTDYIDSHDTVEDWYPYPESDTNYECLAQ